MVQINFAQKSVTVKIVYYGPGMSGKTTNLEIVHQRAPEANKGDLTSISTDGDRTLFFDFMPLDLGTVAGMRTQFQIYTVPGQVYYNSTRKLVLQGVDGVIFVADSSASMLEENLESLSNLAENLIEYGKDIEEIPIVIQYNKRDLPDAMTVEELERHLNPRGAPSFEAMANSGHGVFPTLKSLAARVLDSIHEQTGASGAQGVAAPKPAAPRPAQAPAAQAPAGPAPVPLSAPAAQPAAATPFGQAPAAQPQPGMQPGMQPMHAQQPAAPIPAPQQPAPLAMPAPFPVHAQAESVQQQQQQQVSMSPVAPGPMPASPMPVAPMEGGLEHSAPQFQQQQQPQASGLRMADPVPHTVPLGHQPPAAPTHSQAPPAPVSPMQPAPVQNQQQQRPAYGSPAGTAPRPMAPAGSAPAPRAAAAAPAGRLRPRASAAAAAAGSGSGSNSKGALVTAIVVIAALAAGIAIGGTVFNLI
ncbi:Mutual gliding-motility protein MglA [Planctomycetes bacterium Poly30]|uniref:Mutual gliding-motility protein MglA n=1 Tax=Saltatorellus ferox TaxID=2528018 RepID=A0A518EUL6_9BACT|nr:Mutual gliding-motility protein MglA [Planctomycetes bacterium Poly30]